MFDRHPAISLAPEGEILAILWRRYGSLTDWTEPTRARFRRDLAHVRRLFNWWRLDAAALDRAVARVASGETFAGHCLALYEGYAEASGKPDAAIVGEKNPAYALISERILRLFPEARIVHMVRDPRDTVLSFQKVKFDLKDPAALAQRWVHYNRSALALSRRERGRFRVLRYEDLVANPAGELRGLCDFIEVEFRREMLDFHEQPSHLFDWNKLVGLPLAPDRAHTWKRQMPLAELDIVDAITGPLAGRFGYEVREAPRTRGLLYGIPGRIGGRAACLLEAALPLLPVELQTAVIDRYRSWDTSLGRGAGAG
jgi:hypothetical protein